MMKKRWMFGLLSLVCLFLLSVNCFAAHGDKPPLKKAILLAAFGTTVPEAQKAQVGVAFFEGKQRPVKEDRL